MKIHIKQIPDQGRLFEGEDSAEIMDLAVEEMRFDQPVAYKLYAQLQGDALLVTGRVATTARGRCSRCLKPVALSLESGNFTFHQIVHADETVDLTVHLREDIVLQLPQRALCRDDCNGLCVVCGQDLNVRRCQCRPQTGDLRWRALDKIEF